MTLLLLTGACGSGREDEQAPATNLTATRPSSGNLLDQAPPTPSPIPSPSASPATLSSFPAEFRGRWGMTVNDCDPSRGDDKGKLEVDATTLAFYESRGTATELATMRPGQIKAALAFTGEGQEWTSIQTLTLVNDGRILVREEREPAGAYRYQRCPERP